MHVNSLETKLKTLINVNLKMSGGAKSESLHTYIVDAHIACFCDSMRLIPFTDSSHALVELHSLKPMNFDN